MSTASLPSYERTPSYSTEPHRDERRIAVADRQRSGSFVKQSKGGNVILCLNGQEDNVQQPVYGLGQVEGTVDLPKTDKIESVELKIEGTLHLLEIAERGSASVNLCLNSTLLWSKDTVSATCPHSLPFSLALPTTFTYENKTYPLPPSFHVKLSGLPGFIATIEYSVAAIVAKRPKTLGIHTGTTTTVLSTRFVYYPRSRPPTPLPFPLQHSYAGFQPSSDWKLYESALQSKSTARPDLIMKLYIPASRTYCISKSIPFHLTVDSPSSVSLAMFLPFSPTGNSSSARKITRIQLIRQSTVDVKHEMAALVKGDMWRTDCIGEGIFKHVGDGPTWTSYSGHIVPDKSIKVTGFRAAGLSVKDCIVFAVTPPDLSKSAFHDLREVIPVRLTTDPWIPEGTGISPRTGLDTSPLPVNAEQPLYSCFAR